MKYVSSILTLAGLLLVGSSVAQNQALNVVATTGMVADVVRNVGGDCADVTTLMGPGIDPHLYRASASDVDTFNQADIIFYNGLNLEGQLGEVLGGVGERIRTVAVAEGVGSEDRLLEGEDNFEGQPDPHLWMDVSLWAETADVAAAALGEQRPECADDMTARAESYRAQLMALHDWVAQSIATIPEEQRVLVTAHDAFTYFSQAYDIEVAAIEGISTEAEASLADIREAADTVVETGVPAIFVETTINPRTIEAVQAAARDRGAEVVIGGELFGDAMGEEGSAEGSYIGMIRSNTVTIVGALGGEVAAWPEALADWAESWDMP
ncbi:MAG: zinc ABC transporter substrate-binding protein [Deinococcota bacterium]|nr:zinc ABC transporter substrate-binding protein [Deinococcota bacterium]